jgi:hypothetical protein
MWSHPILVGRSASATDNSLPCGALTADHTLAQRMATITDRSDEQGLRFRVPLALKR